MSWARADWSSNAALATANIPAHRTRRTRIFDIRLMNFVWSMKLC